MIIENDSAKLPHDVSFFSLGGVGEGEEHEGALPCLFDGGHKGSSHRVALHHPLSRQEVDPTLLVGLDGRQRQVHGAGGLIAVDVLGEHLVDGSCPVGFRTVRQAQDAEASEVFCPVGGYPQKVFRRLAGAHGLGHFHLDAKLPSYLLLHLGVVVVLEEGIALLLLKGQKVVQNPRRILRGGFDDELRAGVEVVSRSIRLVAQDDDGAGQEGVALELVLRRGAHVEAGLRLGQSGLWPGKVTGELARGVADDQHFACAGRTGGQSVVGRLPASEEGAGNHDPGEEDPTHRGAASLSPRRSPCSSKGVRRPRRCPGLATHGSS